MAIPKKMKGVILENVGGDFKIVDDIDVPTPGPGQILIKSLVTAVNPVYATTFSKSNIQMRMAPRRRH
jgi:NADPH:quinone reductase-like Zn-dependent oxidoreductase